MEFFKFIKLLFEEKGYSRQVNKNHPKEECINRINQIQLVLSIQSREKKMNENGRNGHDHLRQCRRKHVLEHLENVE